MVAALSILYVRKMVRMGDTHVSVDAAPAPARVRRSPVAGGSAARLERRSACSCS